MKGISYLIIGLALVGLAVAGTLSQQGGFLTFDGDVVALNGAEVEFENLIAQKINNVYYVQENNATDIQTKINLLGSMGGGTLIIPAGDYILENWVNASYDNLIIKNYGNLTFKNGVPFSIVDQENDTQNFHIIFINSENFKLYNYNIWGIRFLANNSENIYITGGLQTYNSIFNSKGIVLENYKTVGTSTWQECTENVIVKNIYCNPNSDSISECMDFNSRHNNVIIENIQYKHEGNPTADEVLDLNDMTNLKITNVQINNGFRPFTISYSSGNRFGTCEGWDNENIYIDNILCQNCNTTSRIGWTNTDFYLNSFIQYSLNGETYTYDTIEQKTPNSINYKPIINLNSPIKNSQLLDRYSGYNYSYNNVVNGEPYFNMYSLFFNSSKSSKIIVQNPQLTDNFSVAIFFKPTKYNADMRIMQKRNNTNTFSFVVASNNRSQFYYFDDISNSSCYLTSSNNNVVYDEWNFIGATYNGTDAIVYFNDEVRTRNCVGVSMTNYDGQLCLGANCNNPSATTQHYEGYLANFQFYDFVLSKYDIYNIRNKFITH